MRDLMMESKNASPLKALEKESATRNRIIAWSLKDIRQELCGNDFVSSDKI
jgi:hypothetical protein